MLRPVSVVSGDTGRDLEKLDWAPRKIQFGIKNIKSKFFIGWNMWVKAGLPGRGPAFEVKY